MHKVHEPVFTLSGLPSPPLMLPIHSENQLSARHFTTENRLKLNQSNKRVLNDSVFAVDAFGPNINEATNEMVVLNFKTKLYDNS